MKFLNRITSLGLIGFSILIGVQSVKLGIGTLGNMGPGFMPIMGCALLLFLSVGVLVGEEKRPKGRGTLTEDTKDTQKKEFLKPAILVSVLLGFTLLLHIVGYLIITFLAVLAMSSLSGSKKWIRRVVFAGLVTLLSFLLFSWLNMELPAGLFRVG